MALTKPPASPVAWPPKGYSKTHKVKTGENWWSLSTQYNRGDAWHIIEFNFGTRDPKEVNWYLHKYVGCRTETPDGKNYRFNSADTPGLLYIPPGSWSPGGSPDNTGPQISEAARSAVLSVLNDPRLSALNCSYETTNGVFDVDLGQEKLTKVRRLVLSREIKVLYDPQLGAPANYDSKHDALTIAFETASTPARRCWILCGALYASLDMQKLGNVVASGVAEAALFGMALYARKVCQTEHQLIHELPGKTKILQLAWRMAKETEERGRPGGDLWNAFAAAVRNDPAFSGKKVNCDGI